jgi:hypothetical protein
MRVTLSGHASVLVELDGATCLMDPVFADPFEEGTVVSCPQRTIDADRLPPIDILVVSHRHPDHFDLASIARVDRRADAVCPGRPSDRLRPRGARVRGRPRGAPDGAHRRRRIRALPDALRAPVDPRDGLRVPRPNWNILESGRHAAGARHDRRRTGAVLDTWRVAFDPTAPVPPLRDDNPDGYVDSDIATATGEVILGGVAGYVERDSGSDDHLLDAYALHRATYRVDVVFPDDRVRWYQFDFGDQPPRVTDGPGVGPSSDLAHRIAASALTGWSRHARSFFSVRASSRRAGAIHQPVRDGDDVRIETRPCPIC